MSHLRPVRKIIAFLCFSATLSISSARADETISRLVDGRYLVQVKDATVALTEEDPTDTQTGFYVSTPPGTSPFHFYLTDLVRDPERYASRLRLSEWSSVSVGMTRRHPGEIDGIPVVKGVNRVAIVSGVNRGCDAWNPEWDRLREAALNMTADQYGWIRRDDTKISSSTFIKFLDNANRAAGRFYGLSCNFSGGCSVMACHDSLTAIISIYSSNKIQGQDFSVKDFDQQIASGIKVLEHMLVNKPVDVSHP
jgi:hypothetical protein